ncbi:hypothetical protein D3C71_2118910 [compost metagenome]
MLGIAGLHIGFLELFEPRPVDMPFAWPDVSQPPVDPFGLGAQEGEIMHVGRVEGADQQDAMIEAFGRLM